MKSTILGLSISLMALCFSCSSGHERPRVTMPLTPPEKTPIPVTALGCSQFALQEDRDNCEKAGKQFEPPPVTSAKPSSALFEPSVKRDKSGKIELSGKPADESKNPLSQQDDSASPH